MDVTYTKPLTVISSIYLALARQQQIHQRALSVLNVQDVLAMLLSICMVEQLHRSVEYVRPRTSFA